MAFYERPYKVYAILGDPSVEPIWRWDRWQVFAKLLDPVFALCRGKALLGSNQFLIGQRKEVKFGKLVWNDTSHQKWTHASPLTAPESDKWAYFFTVGYAPSLPVCSREGKPPDFYFLVNNENYLTRTITPQFNPLIVLCVAADMPPSVLAAVEDAVRQAAQMVSARLCITIDRPWGFAWGTTGTFTRAINDITTTGLFKVGNYHARPLDLATFVEPWRLFS